LKYKNLNSHLDLWENYVVEMDFDGKTLQSWWAKYLISNQNGAFIYLVWNSMNDKIFARNINWDNNNKLSLPLVNDKIYTIFIKRKENNVTLYIYDKKEKKEIYNSGEIDKAFDLNQMNIGSSSSSRIQLHWMIYNLKVYKKK
jgi:hypothetical protein